MCCSRRGRAAGAGGRRSRRRVNSSERNGWNRSTQTKQERGKWSVVVSALSFAHSSTRKERRLVDLVGKEPSGHASKRDRQQQQARKNRRGRGGEVVGLSKVVHSILLQIV